MSRSRLLFIGVALLTLLAACNGRRSGGDEPSDAADAGAPLADAADVSLGDAAPDGSDAARDASDAAPDVTPDAPGDADVSPPCDRVCTRWVDPEPPDDVDVVRVVSDVCNPTGVAPTRCPAGTTCSGREQGWTGPARFVDRALCVADGPVVLALDAPDEREGSVDVALTLTWNGGPWPYTGLEGGEMTVVDADGARVARLTSWERDGGAVELRVPPGTYRVSFSPPSEPSSEAVVLTRSAELVVVADGAATLDAEGLTVQPQLAVDGDAIDRVPAGWGGLLLQLRTADGFLRTTRHESGEPLPAAWSVQARPLRLTAAAGGGDVLPAGWLGESAPEPVPVTPGDTVTLSVDARRVTWSGSVTLDDAPAYGEVLVLDAADQLHTAPLDADGRWTLERFAGDGQLAWRALPDPARPARLTGRSAFVAASSDAPTDLALATTTVRGTLTVDGTPVRNPTAGLRYVTEAGAVADVALDAAGAFAGRVFAGPGAVYVVGDGRVVPLGGAELRAGLAPGPEFDALDVPAARWTLTLRAEGSLDPLGGPADAGGRLAVTAVDPADGRPRTLPSPRLDQPLPEGLVVPLAAEPWSRELLVSPGDWAATWTAPDTAPSGSLRYAPATVADGTQRTLEVPLRDVTFELRVDGELVVGDTEGSAGALLVGDRIVPLPAGPARLVVPLYAGAYDVTYVCRATEGCRGLAATSNRRRLLEGLGVE